MDAIITESFHNGLTASDIVRNLAVNGFDLSLRQLRRHLARLGLYRREYDNVAAVQRFIVGHVTQNSSCLFGYRTMYWKCRLAGFRVRYSHVCSVVNAINPQISSARRARRLFRRAYYVHGPNALWHIDGYDKLKPFGFAIHGCIDGFSRKMIWLECGSSNNDPKIIAGYFMSAVVEIAGRPVCVRGDFGTENGNVRLCQLYFGLGDDKSFKYGASTANQRIESWW